MIPFHYVDLSYTPIEEQLKLEEALLRADTRNFCLINHGSPPAIVLGISGNVSEHVDTPSPLPLIRRFSGGGTVAIDEHTCFVTLIANAHEVPVPCFPEPILHYCGEFYRSLIPSFSIQENDYTIGHRKWGGNAQYLTKNRWLHHTSILWDYDPSLMNLLKNPSKQPSYRKNRNHEDFICTLKPLFPSKELFFKKLYNSFSEKLHLLPCSLESLAVVKEKKHRSSTRLVEF